MPLVRAMRTVGGRHPHRTGPTERAAARGDHRPRLPVHGRPGPMEDLDMNMLNIELARELQRDRDRMVREA
jgi:hypothetical protein